MFRSVPLRPHIVVVALALLILVPLLAYLQYHWIGQISGQEHERMRVNLQTAAFHFTRSFGEEYWTLMRAFASDPGRLAADPSVETAVRLQEWRFATHFPELVKDVLYRRTGEGSDSLWSFDGMQFGPAQIALPGLPPIGTLDTEPGWTTMRFEAGRSLHLRNDLTAIAIPLPSGVGEDPADGLVIVLDSVSLHRVFIPRLASASLRPGDAPDYEYSIVTRYGPERTIFTTLGAGAAVSRGEADVEVGLLQVPPFGLSAPPGPRGGVPPPGDERDPGADGWRGGPDHGRRGDTVRFDGPGPRPIPRGSRRMDQAPFVLRVRHPAGSLDAAVNQSRIRNIAISSGILLLMGVALVVLLVSSHRLQQLADRQIAFVAGVSHEFRTPLAVLHSAGENLADGVVTDPGRIRSYGQLIRTEVQRLSTLGENALAYAGIHAGRKEYARVPTALADVITKAISAVQPQLMESGIRVDVAIPSELPPLSADAAALGGALQNLISNAAKYSGGTTTIGVRAVWRAAAAGGGEVAIVVEDHGIGIEPGEIKHIFEPFYRTREVRERQIRGNGLGLNLAQHVVCAHGGTITVQSTPGKGSRFTIHLPLSTSEGPTA